MISLLVTLIVLGLVFYCISLIPMAEPYPSIIRVVAVILAIIAILNGLGLYIAPGLR